MVTISGRFYFHLPNERFNLHFLQQWTGFIVQNLELI